MSRRLETLRQTRPTARCENEPNALLPMCLLWSPHACGFVGQASLEPYRKASYEIMSIFARYCPLTERRSEERSVGKECGSTCRSRGSSVHYKNKQQNNK